MVNKDGDNTAGKLTPVQITNLQSIGGWKERQPIVDSEMPLWL